MANTTDTYWEINGVSLQTFAYNITTWGGDLQAPPPLRGSDLTIPYRPGEVLQKRRPTGRTVTFNMWLIGADTNGNIPSSAPSRDYFRSSFTTLRNVLWNGGNPVTIKKKWKDGAGVVQTATATGVFASGLSPIMTGNARATFSVEFYLPDPFFYGAEETVSFSSSTATQSVTLTPKGDYETTELTIDFQGARNNMRLTNDVGVYVNVNQDLLFGQTIRLDANAWTATKNPGGSEANVIGSVSNFGHEFWMVLRAGVSQKLTLSSSSGTGNATLKYKPRYI